MSYAPLRRGTLLIPSHTYDRPDLKHLFVICTDECANGNFVIVPIQTWTNHLCDAACQISAGEHAFVRRPSFVQYRYARIEARSVLELGVSEQTFIPHQDVTEELLNRIRDGLCKSINTKIKVRKYLGCLQLPV